MYHATRKLAAGCSVSPSCPPYRCHRAAGALHSRPKDRYIATSTMASGGRGQGGGLSKLDGRAPDGQDFANYFCTYAFLYHQKDMLEDHKRTGAYYNAVIQNRRMFKDKVVLDVGTGSGILAIFAAKAGAKKVYAVEATNMAKHARALVEHNKFGDVIEVIQGVIETVELPEKVDIIISEWMGYFLLRESMLDSVLLARDKFLKPGGALYPSHARMFLAPMRTNAAAQRVNDFQNSMYGWSEFLKEMKGFYQVDFDCLSEAYRTEQKDYYLSTSAWGNVHPSQLMGPGVCFKKYDLLTVTIEELKADLVAEASLPVADGGSVDAFCGWFDVTFQGSPENPADDIVKLPTGPDATGPTHWGQQVFMMHPSIDCASGDDLQCKIKVSRQKENHRLLELDLQVKVTGKSMHATGEVRQLNWHID